MDDMNTDELWIDTATALKINVLFTISSQIKQARLNDSQISSLSHKFLMLCSAKKDLNQDVSEFLANKTLSFALNPDAKIPDIRPGVRLQIAVETIPQLIYSMFEIVAKILNRVDGAFPQKFKKIAQNMEEISLKPPYTHLKKFLISTNWYFKAREIRTEWTHFSASLIMGSENNEPSFFLLDFRKSSDKKEFKRLEPVKLSLIKELAENACGAVGKISDFVVDYLVVSGILNLTDSINRSTIKGLSNGTFEMETVTVQKALLDCGFKIEARNTSCTNIEETK